MIVSVFADGERKDKVAEFYDTKLPTTFLRGILEESREHEMDTSFTFQSRMECNVCFGGWDKEE